MSQWVADITIRIRCTIFLMLLFTSFSVLSATYTEAPLKVEKKIDSAFRAMKNGWVFIHIEGTPFERGAQYGYLIEPELKQFFATYQFLVPWDTGKSWNFFVESADKLFSKRVDPEYLEEIKGIAAGANKAGLKITWQDVLTLNVFDELLYSWWPMQEKNANPFAVKELRSRCTGIVATGTSTTDGKIVLGHITNDDFIIAQNQNIILDIKPSKGHRIIMQTMPGYIFSDSDFFITDAGLTGTETVIDGINTYHLDKNGIPAVNRIRKAMQYADTMDQWASIMLKGNTGGNASLWLLADRNTNEIMSFELATYHHSVEKKKDGYFVSYNVPMNLEIRNLESNNGGYGDIRRNTGARAVRLKQLLKENDGKIDIDVIKKIFADHFDVYLNKNNPSARTIDSHYELDAEMYMSQPDLPFPFQPQGSVDGTVTDSSLVEKMSFVGRWGSPSGMPFYAKKFLKNHPQWDDQIPYLRDRPSEPWTYFSAS